MLPLIATQDEIHSFYGYSTGEVSITFATHYGNILSAFPNIHL